MFESFETARVPVGRRCAAGRFDVVWVVVVVVFGLIFRFDFALVGRIVFVFFRIVLITFGLVIRRRLRQSIRRDGVQVVE